MELRQDLHIHTHRSNCGKPCNTVRAIIETAERQNLLLAGITDHIDLPEQAERFREIYKANRADAAKFPSQCRILIGAEASMISPETCALPDDLARKLDFVIVSCNHYHLLTVSKPPHPDPISYAEHHLAMIRGAAALGFAVVIAHPFLNDYCDPKLAAQTLKKYKEKDLAHTLDCLAKAHVALEVNPYRVVNALGWFKDLVKEARRRGVRFSLGSDAHTLERIGFPPVPIEAAKGTIKPADVCERIGLTLDDLVWPFISSGTD